MYSIGDKIVHPMHGAGTITDITTQTIDGKDVQYYILNLPTNNMTLMVPVASCNDIGLRDVISAERADELIALLPSLETEEDSNWNKRFRENSARIKTGNLEEVIRVVKALTARDKKSGLSTGERKMLHSARQIFLSELVLAKKLSFNDAEAIFDEILFSSLK